MMVQDILTGIAGGIARLTINRPQSRNAVNGQMLKHMADFVTQIAADTTVRALLIQGAGAHFMAGGDVRAFSDVLHHPPEERRHDFQHRSIEAAPLWVALHEMPQPVLVAVRGFAAGAAISLVAGADLVIASATAQFVLAQVGLGLVADAASTFHLPRAIGLRAAKQMAFLGDRVDANEALRLGLVNWVVADADLEPRTEEILARLASGPSLAVAEAKRLLNQSAGTSIEAQIAAEGTAVGRCAASQDMPEGIRAFLEKRRPVFHSR